MVVPKQLQEACLNVLPANPTVDDPPKILWKNRHFLQEDSLARKDAKGRKSWIRWHGLFLIKLNYQNHPIGNVWYYSPVRDKGEAEFFSVQPPRLQQTASTGLLVRHLASSCQLCH